MNPGLTYNMQETFNMEGYLAIKVTPLRANLCLLEERGNERLHNWLLWRSVLELVVEGGQTMETKG